MTTPSTPDATDCEAYGHGDWFVLREPDEPDAWLRSTVVVDVGEDVDEPASVGER